MTLIKLSQMVNHADHETFQEPHHSPAEAWEASLKTWSREVSDQGSAGALWHPAGLCWSFSVRYSTISQLSEVIPSSSPNLGTASICAMLLICRTSHSSIQRSSLKTCSVPSRIVINDFKGMPSDGFKIYHYISSEFAFLNMDFQKHAHEACSLPRGTPVWLSRSTASTTLKLAKQCNNASGGMYSIWQVARTSEKCKEKKVTLYIYIDTMNLRQKTTKNLFKKQKKTLGLLVILKVPKAPARRFSLDTCWFWSSWFLMTHNITAVSLYVVLRTVSLQYLTLQNMLLFLHFCMLFPTFVFTCLSFWERCKMISITSASDLHVQFTKTPKLLSYSQLQTKQQTASFHGPIFHCRW